MKIITSIVLVAALAITISEALNHKVILGLNVPKNVYCKAYITLDIIDVTEKCTTLTSAVLITQHKIDGMPPKLRYYIESSFTVNLEATYNIYNMKSIYVVFVPEDEEKCENIDLRTVYFESSQTFMNKKNEKLETEKVIDLSTMDSPAVLPFVSNKKFFYEIKLQFSASKDVDCAAKITLEGLVNPDEIVMTETFGIKFHSETQLETKNVLYTPTFTYGMESIKIGFQKHKKLRSTNCDQIYLNTVDITFTNVFHFDNERFNQKLIFNEKLHLVKK